MSNEYDKGYTAGLQDGLKNADCKFECKKMNARIKRKVFRAGYMANQRRTKGSHPHNAMNEHEDWMEFKND